MSCCRGWRQPAGSCRPGLLGPGNSGPGIVSLQAQGRTRPITVPEVCFSTGRRWMRVSVFRGQSDAGGTTAWPAWCHLHDVLSHFSWPVEGMSDPTGSYRRTYEVPRTASQGPFQEPSIAQIGVCEAMVGIEIEAVKLAAITQWRFTRGDMVLQFWQLDFQPGNDPLKSCTSLHIHWV